MKRQESSMMIHKIKRDQISLEEKIQQIEEFLRIGFP